MTQNRVADDVLVRWTRRNHHLEEMLLKGADPDPILQGMQWLAEGKQLQVVEPTPTLGSHGHELYGYLMDSVRQLMTYNTLFEWGVDNRELWDKCFELKRRLIPDAREYMINSNSSPKQLLWVLHLATPWETLQAYIKMLAARSQSADFYRQLKHYYGPDEFRLSSELEFHPSSIRLVEIDLLGGYNHELEVTAHQLRKVSTAWVEVLAAAVSFRGWWDDYVTYQGGEPVSPCLALPGCEFSNNGSAAFLLGAKLGKNDRHNGAEVDFNIYDSRVKTRHLAAPKVGTLGMVEF